MTDKEKGIATNYILYSPLNVPDLYGTRFDEMGEREIRIHQGLVLLRTEILPEFLNIISEHRNYLDLTRNNNIYHLEYEREFIYKMQYYGYGSREVREYWDRKLGCAAYQDGCSEWSLAD